MLIHLPNAIGDAATNMGIDAALLTTLPAGMAVFRHYGWLEPSITFGYTQKFSDIENVYTDHGLTLCRRLTGGGIVDHRDDWTYALILENSIPTVRLNANELYLSIHQAIQTALFEQQVETKLAPCPRRCDNRTEAKPNTSTAQCFVTPAANDVLLPNCEKVAGAAMKRTRNGLLIQGSISRVKLPKELNFGTFQNALISGLSKRLALSMGEIGDLRPLFNSEQIARERQRFNSHNWQHKR